MRKPVPVRVAPFLLAILPLTLSAEAGHAQDARPLTFTDLMQIRQVEDPSISADGRWLAFTAEPDRGDPEVVVREVDGSRRFATGPADRPVLSSNGLWVAARTVPSLEERERAEDAEELHDGVTIIGLPEGAVVELGDARAFAFSGDGGWLAYHLYADEPAAEERGADEGPRREAAGGGDQPPAEDRDFGTTLVLRELATGTETRIDHVGDFRFHDRGDRLAYTVVAPEPDADGLRVRELATGEDATVDDRPAGRYTALTWREDVPELAFVASVGDSDDGPPRGTVMAWDGQATTTLVTEDDAPDGWIVPADNTLSWSEDGDRLFFGWRALRPDEGREDAPGGEREEASGDFAPYDTADILAERTVDVWHWRDPRIVPQQKVLWPRERNRTFLAVHHRDTGRTVALADPDVPDVDIPGNARVALAESDVPYRLEATWMGGQSDAWIVELSTGERTRFAERIRSGADLSPDGRYAVWYQDGDYHLYDVGAGSSRNVTADFPVPMADEDHDYPEPAPGYGVAGWLADDAAVLLRDKYDLWVVPTDGSPAWSLTDGRGRQEQRVFRIVDVDGEDDAIGTSEALLLSSYHDLEKNFGFYRARADRPGVSRLLDEDRRFQFVAAAEDTDRILYTREAYDEFPDLWVAGPDFADRRKVTDVNPGLTERFAWGSAELVEWTSLDGTPLQGVVIKPGNYEEGKRYPVLVYYYRFFSQRLHEFNDPSVNHRPSFPVYASDGYVVFLPDVRFEVGQPGFAATKSVVPGVQRLVELGIADPDAVALHGHSWSGYQTAFMVTQTDIFATAIAGAPVSNMTSAYSGIRLGSGLARQFQYEMSQSRIGGSLWEALDEYVENSPVFFADRIETPLLILHGDVDDAVPWEQSIEMYLAMRRLGKEAVFLQYRDEPHHPQRYANKLDWSVKMKEWLDHYLKGEPAPAWITHGVPYTGG